MYYYARAIINTHAQQRMHVMVRELAGDPKAHLALILFTMVCRHSDIQVLEPEDGKEAFSRGSQNTSVSQQSRLLLSDRLICF